MKAVGATFGTSDPHTANAVIVSHDVGLFDFIMADHTLCQVSDVEMTSNIDVESAKKIAIGQKKAVINDVLTELSVIGSYNAGQMSRVNHPIPPGTKIMKASKKIISKYLGFENRGVEVGSLLRRPDVRVALDRKVFDNHIAVIGMTDQGKSNTGKILIEQMVKHNLKIVVIDPHGEYEGRVIKIDDIDPAKSIDKKKLLKLLSENVEPSMRKILNDIIMVAEFGELKGSYINRLVASADDENVTGGSSARLFIEGMLKLASIENVLTEKLLKFRAGKPIVINLNGVSKTQSQEIVNIIAKRCLEQGKAGRGFYLVVDEAHRFTPQKSTPACKEALIDLAQEGRKFGCGMIILSQRPANVDKDVLSQANTKFCMKVGNDNDIRQIRYSTEHATLQMFKEVQVLRRGEALVSSSYLERPVFVKIDKYGGK